MEVYYRSIHHAIKNINPSAHSQEALNSVFVGLWGCGKESSGSPFLNTPGLSDTLKN